MTVDCVFCSIAAHDLPATIRYEDNRLMVIDDIHPKAKIHLLIVPKQHLASLNAVGDDANALLGSMLSVARKQAQGLGIADNGYKLVLNTGHDGGQDIPHLHLHLLGGERIGTFAPV